MQSKASHPIGVFDSGIGGTSIWKEIHSLMPNEKTIYLADSKHAPYGAKSKDEIIALSVKNTEFLLNKGCKTIVVACNTATTNAISYLRANYSVPFIGIEPAIKPAALRTNNNSIGILATKGTLNSTLFEQTSNTIDLNIKVIEQVGEGLVSLIENGKLHSQEMTTLLNEHLVMFKEKNIDCLVLGCTHYPYLIPQIQEILGPNVSIIDSGEAVARQTKKVLETNKLHSNLTSKQTNYFYSNANTQSLQSLLSEYDNLVIENLEF